MAATRSFVTLLALTLATMAALAAVSAPPAFADRCQPEEFVRKPSPIPESADPKCPVMDELVYPMLGCPPAPATLPDCAMQVAGNPRGTATTVVGNAPNAPTYAQNAAYGAVANTFNLVSFLAGPVDPYAPHDAACRALGGTPGRQGKIPVCYAQDPL